jgi:uncharacterized protein DUF3301
MIQSLLPLIVVLAALYLWQGALRTRDRARSLGHALCAQAGVQLLDQTVALRRMRVRRYPGRGLHLWRCYGFDFSTDGTDRRRGSLDLVDGEIVAHDLGLGAPAGAIRTGNVIELQPGSRTQH